jgi:hypothetical protein
MKTSAYYPYRSEAARDSCFALFDTVAAREWPIVSEERTVSTSYGPTFVRISGPTSTPPLVLLAGAATTSLMWRRISRHYPPGTALSLSTRSETGRSFCTRPLPLFQRPPRLAE